LPTTLLPGKRRARVIAYADKRAPLFSHLPVVLLERYAPRAVPYTLVETLFALCALAVRAFAEGFAVGSPHAMRVTK
jgi:hypothetical protein